MARKKVKGRLPSGNYRIRVYDYTDDEGKKHYKSFTGRTKAEASAKVSEWKESKRELRDKVTVHRACEDYIILKEAVLSPTTVRGYKSYVAAIEKHSVAKIDLKDVTNIDLQRFVSELSRTTSPKYVANVAAFMTSAIAVYLPNFKVNLTLPPKVKPDLYTPNEDDVQALLDACGTDELKVAILFAAVGTMRRGEVCAVTFADINYRTHTVSVNKSRVYDGTSYIIKTPKTYESTRVIKMPEYVFDLIKGLNHGGEYVVNMDPSQLYRQFSKALKKAGLPSFRFHDLRHFAASNMHAAGVPERYIEAIGGWKPGSNVLKRVYENVMDSELIKIESAMAEKNIFVV